MAQPQAVNIQDQFERGVALREAKANRGAGLVENVKLLGKVSANKRVYSDRALTDATRLYNHAPFYLDHPTERELRERGGLRSVLDLAGEIVNVRRVGDEVRGDIRLLDREPARSLVFALAEQMPHQAGNSHRARGTVRPGQDGEIVESIEEVFAMELVTDPATTRGLFESVERDRGTDMDYKALTVETLTKERPDLVEAIQKTAKGGDEVAVLRQENATLKEQAAKRTRVELVEKKLAAAKLPAAAITDAFRTQLIEAKDEAAIDTLLADRQAVAAPKGGPRSLERDVREDRGEVKPIDEAKIAEYATRLGL